MQAVQIHLHLIKKSIHEHRIIMKSFSATITQKGTNSLPRAVFRSFFNHARKYSISDMSEKFINIAENLQCYRFMVSAKVKK